MTEEPKNSNRPPAKVPELRPSLLAKYSDIFHSMSDPAFLVELDTFRILEINEITEKSMKIKEDNLIGRSIMDLVLEGHGSIFEKNLRIVRRRYFSRNFDAKFLRGDKRIIRVEISAGVLRLKNGTGVLQIIAKDVTQVRESEKKIAKYLSQLEKANQKLEALSITDDLTNLSNFRHLRKEMALEHERAERYGSPYSIVFFDVDHFKEYNDSHGHLSGDEALRRVAAVLAKQSRGTDLPARYGGEEFAVLCRGVGWNGAKVLAERCLRSIREAEIPYGDKQPLGHFSVSCGISSYPSDGATSEQILEAADQALYHSKETGRDRITTQAELTGREKEEQISKIIYDSA